MKLSIIICVYNTDKYFLRKALESIQRSTLRDYEICMVDDGSQEDYSNLAKEFGVRLSKTKNRGILCARLHGIGMAQGDYLAFFDSDDTVTINYHQPMIDMAEKENADIVMNDWAFHTEKSRYYCRTDSSIASDFCIEGNAVFDRFMSQEGREHSYYVTWNKIYRRHLLLTAKKEIEASPLFGQKICYGEDVLFNFYAFREAKKLCNVHTGYYFYRMHANQSVNVIHKERLRAQIEAMGAVFAQMRTGIADSPNKNSRISHFFHWQELMSRTHYSYAKANKYIDLFPFIQSVYGVQKLKKSIWRDSAVYYKVSLLPNNFEEIDSALRPLFGIQVPIEICYEKRNRYVACMVSALQHSGKDIRFNKHASYTVPKGNIRPTDKILHNDLVYAIGVLLFKKGSRLRALLKRIL